MFAELSSPWQAAFALAWDAFCRGNVPVGCVVVDRQQQIVARGQNAIFDDETITPLAGTNLAHAEMAALSKLKNREHDLGDYSLYTTLEPCPMCFGAIVMTGVRQVRFAARDGLAGSAVLASATPYLRAKKLTFVFEPSPLEVFQLALSTAFEQRRQHPRKEVILASWRAHCPQGVSVGTTLFQQGYFAAAVQRGLDVGQVYAEVMANLASNVSGEEEYLEGSIV